MTIFWSWAMSEEGLLKNGCGMRNFGGTSSLRKWLR